jgi:hypothetical protein
MTDTPADIIAQADEALQDLETVLASAVVKATEAVNANPSASNLKALQSAKQSLADHRALKAAEKKPEEKQLKNIREVAAYLQAAGWKISERKAYDDKRLIKYQKDGTYLAKDADEYAQRYLQRLNGNDAAEGLAAVKLRKEIELHDERIERERRRNKVEAGKLILRSRVEQQFAARASFLLSDLETFAHTKMTDIVEAVLDGQGIPPEAETYADELKARIIPELIAAYNTELRRWIDRYSQPIHFQAPMVSELEDLDEDLDEDAE